MLVSSTTETKFSGFKTLLKQGISEPIFYDLVYKFKRIVGKPTFSDQFKKIIKSYKKLNITWISCDNLHVWLQTQSWFIAIHVVSSFITRLWVRPQTQ